MVVTIVPRRIMCPDTLHKLLTNGPRHVTKSSKPWPGLRNTHHHPLPTTPSCQTTQDTLRSPVSTTSQSQVGLMVGPAWIPTVSDKQLKALTWSQKVHKTPSQASMITYSVKTLNRDRASVVISVFVKQPFTVAAGSWLTADHHTLVAWNKEVGGAATHALALLRVQTISLSLPHISFKC